MNWYKRAQQSLMFYPYGAEPNQQGERVRPISFDQERQENVYECADCGEPVLEEDVEKWYTDKAQKEDVSYQMPPYKYENILQSITQVSQYLLPFYQQLQQYIQDENLESKRNNTYDYGYRSAIGRWEVQVPQLPDILRNSQGLVDICSFQYGGYNGNGICDLFNTTEISGSKLNDLSDIILNPEQESKKFMEYSSKQFEIPRSYPLCYDCFGNMVKCEFCNEQIFPDDRKYQTTWSDTDYVCEKCIENGHADTCSDCGKADSQDSMHWREDEGSLCSDCHQNLGEKSTDWANEQIANLDILVGKNLPISPKVLSSLSTFLERYVKKYGNNVLNNKEWGRLSHLSKKRSLPQGAIEYLDFIEKTYVPESDSYASENVQDILGDINNNIEAQEYMKEQYPNLKSYQDLPFDIKVMSSYSNEVPGFTIGITPSKDFFDFAEKKYPNIKNIWDKMGQTPHHNGTLAYARCAFDMGNSLVINNLQRDADYDNFISQSFRGANEEDKIAAKWLDITTKNWDSFLLNLVKSMCISQNINAYLTTFDQQKQKWGNLPIHKSRKTYEEVPERMGFPLSDPEYGASGLVERGGYGDMYQVADNIGMNWYKKAQFNYETEEERTTISSPQGKTIVTETYPRYEFLEDLTPEEFEALGLDEDEPIAKIEHIEVDIASRGLGYGGQLLSKAIQEAESMGVNFTYLNACPIGTDGLSLEDLTTFYQKYGFFVFKNQGNNNLMGKI